MKTPEVESYSRRTGLEMGLFVTEPNTGDFAVKLKPGHKRGTEDVVAELREQIEESEPALEVEFVGIVPDVIGDLQGNPEPIAPNMTLFAHMIIMDSETETAMTLGRTYLTTESQPKPLSRHDLDLIVQ